MLARLDAATDPINALQTVDEPFSSHGSTQYGIVADQTHEAGQTAAPKVSAPQGDWDTSRHSGSPHKRADYVRGTTAELRARIIREVKTADHLLLPPP